MPKQTDSNGVVTYTLGAGDVVINIIPAKDGYCELTIAHTARPGGVGACADQDTTPPDIRIVIPTRELLDIFLNRMNRGVDVVRNSKQVFDPRMF
jgi:hypothetical protein